MSMTTRLLLDTSAVISRPDTSAIPPDAELMISTITLAELNAGLHSVSDPVRLADRVARLQQVITEFVPIPFTSTDARMYGQLIARVLAAGRNPRSRQLDLLIASVAATREMPLVTRNADDFRVLAPLVEVIDLGGPGGG